MYLEITDRGSPSGFGRLESFVERVVQLLDSETARAKGYPIWHQSG